MSTGAQSGSADVSAVDKVAWQFTGQGREGTGSSWRHQLSKFPDLDSSRKDKGKAQALRVAEPLRSSPAPAPASPRPKAVSPGVSAGGGAHGGPTAEPVSLPSTTAALSVCSLGLQ